MRKFVPAIIIVMMLLFTGCPDKEETNTENNKVNVMRVELKSAKIFMDNYFRYLMKRNNGAMRSFYGSNIKAKLKDTPPTANPHPIGFSVNEGETKDKKAVFKVHIFSGSTGLPYFSDDEFKYTVAMENKKMVIEDISKGKSLEVYKKITSLYKREGDKLKGDKLVSLKDLPAYVVPTEASSIEQKYILPKKEFGPCAVSPDGKAIIISSYDTNSFIGLVEEPSSETMAQPGGGGKSSGNKGGGGGQDSGQKEQQGQEQEQETKPNMKMKTVDFYFNSMVNSICFSPDGDKFMVEYTPLNGLSQILLYKSNSGEQVKLEPNKQFRKDRFSRKNAYFSSPDEIIFTLVPAKNATPEERKYKGDWKLNIKKGELKQLE